MAGKKLAAEPKKLSERERRFVEAYMGQAAGNGTRAALLAGYGKDAKTARTLAARLLAKVGIREAVADRVAKAETKSIADRAERQEFYTNLMRSPETAERDRLKAAELLGKTQGDFVQKVELDHSGQVRVVRVPDRAKSAADWESGKP